jgi:hypothetical protein
MRSLVIFLLVFGIVGCGTNTNSGETEYLYLSGDISLVDKENTIYVDCTSALKDEDTLTDEGYACGVKTDENTIIEKDNGKSMTIEEIQEILNEKKKLNANVYLSEDVELKKGNEIYTATKIIISN